MGQKCIVCSKEDILNRECSYCGQLVCTDHRLPENHNCAGGDGDTADTEAWFRGTGGQTRTPRTDSGVVSGDRRRRVIAAVVLVVVLGAGVVAFQAGLI